MAGPAAASAACRKVVHLAAPAPLLARNSSTARTPIDRPTRRSAAFTSDTSDTSSSSCRTSCTRQG